MKPDLGAVQADVCRLLQAVPRSMSACMREFFQRMDNLDPQLRTQLAEWLAYHLSNFDFMWPWAKWSYVLQAPPHDAQRHVPSPACCEGPFNVPPVPLPTPLLLWRAGFHPRVPDLGEACLASSWQAVRCHSSQICSSTIFSYVQMDSKFDRHSSLSCLGIGNSPALQSTQMSSSLLSIYIYV